MSLSEGQKREIKDKIVTKLNFKYDEAVRECNRIQQESLDRLQQEAQKQLDYATHSEEDVTSLTVREILELERDS